MLVFRLVSTRFYSWYADYRDKNFRFLFFFKQISGNANFRHFASSTDGKRNAKNYGTVNKNRTEKVKKVQPSLTIYPFSIDELKEPKLFHKAIDENVKKINNVQSDGSREKNTQNEIIEQTRTETQHETEQIVKKIAYVWSAF